jgi:hypothetical protein
MARNRAARANETPEQRARRLATQKAWDQRRRAEETPEQRAARLAVDREVHRKRHAALTDAERQELAEHKREYVKRKRSTEIPAERERRLSRQRIHVRKYRENRTEAAIKRDTKRNRQYRKANQSVLEAKRRRRKKASPSLRIKDNLRTRIWKSVQAYGGKKSGSTEKLLGTTMDHFMAWVADQFDTGMSWTNYGEWHLDHIIPCAAFDLTQRPQQLIAFNYQNLRPLWGHENIRKGKRVPVSKPRNGWTLASVRRARRVVGRVVDGQL